MILKAFARLTPRFWGRPIVSIERPQHADGRMHQEVAPRGVDQVAGRSLRPYTYQFRVRVNFATPAEKQTFVQNFNWRESEVELRN